jgi:hypothetical protein
MPQFTLSERWLHPEGTFPAQLVEWSESTGQFGDRIKWTFETNQTTESGEPGKLHYFTGLNISARSKLGALIMALGGTLPETKEAAEAFDPEQFIGKVCRLRILHEPGSDGTDWSNIKELFPAKKLQPTLTATPAGGKSPPKEDDADDPFAQE